jgi:hypothetical protein
MGSAGVASAADRARLLSDLALALTGASTDLDKILDVAARAASALVGDSGVVRVADDAGWPDKHHQVRPRPARRPGHRRHAPGGAAARRRGTVRGSRRVRKAVGEQRGHAGSALSANVLEQTRPYLEQVGIRAMVLLPLVADGGYLGYLSMSRHGRIARTPTRRCGWAPTSPRGWR